MTKRYWRRKRSVAVGTVLAGIGAASLVFLFVFAGQGTHRMWLIAIFLFVVGGAVLVDEFFSPVIDPEILPPDDKGQEPEPSQVTQVARDDGKARLT
jgi:hypothetical protein